MIETICDIADSKYKMLYEKLTEEDGTVIYEGTVFRTHPFTFRAIQHVGHPVKLIEPAQLQEYAAEGIVQAIELVEMGSSNESPVIKDRVRLSSKR